MADFILVDGDQVQFIPAFGQAIVVVRPGKIRASGKDQINRKKMCVLGDEKSVFVSGCQYMSGAFSIPGSGKLTIKALGPQQIAMKTKTSNGKKVLLKGEQFEAEFTVTVPAKMPTPPGPPVPDPVRKYLGKGFFQTNNLKEKGE